MKKEKLEKFLHKKVKVLADVGDNKVFSYLGELTEVTDDNISIVHEKFGETVLNNKLVLQISENGREKV